MIEITLMFQNSEIDKAKKVLDAFSENMKSKAKVKFDNEIVFDIGDFLYITIDNNQIESVNLLKKGETIEQFLRQELEAYRHKKEDLEKYNLDHLFDLYKRIFEVIAPENSIFRMNKNGGFERII